jgi:hypothetical protein
MPCIEGGIPEGKYMPGGAPDIGGGAQDCMQEYIRYQPANQSKNLKSSGDVRDGLLD